MLVIPYQINYVNLIWVLGSRGIYQFFRCLNTFVFLCFLFYFNFVFDIPVCIHRCAHVCHFRLNSLTYMHVFMHPSIYIFLIILYIYISLLNISVHLCSLLLVDFQWCSLLWPSLNAHEKYRFFFNLMFVFFYVFSFI